LYFAPKISKLTPGALRLQFERLVLMLLTQAEIARRLNVSPESIRLWRKAGVFPSPVSDAQGKRPRWSTEAVAQFWREHNAWREEAPEPEEHTVALSPFAALWFGELRWPYDLYERGLEIAELLSDDSPRAGQGGLLERAWQYQTLASERDRMRDESTVVGFSKPSHVAPDHATKIARAQRRAAIERQYSDQEISLLRAVLVDDEPFDKAGARIGVSAEAAKTTLVDCVQRLAERT
jgi:hypothetical protein